MVEAGLKCSISVANSISYAFSYFVLLEASIVAHPIKASTCAFSINFFFCLPAYIVNFSHSDALLNVNLKQELKLILDLVLDIKDLRVTIAYSIVLLCKLIISTRIGYSSTGWNRWQLLSRSFRA